MKCVNTQLGWSVTFGSVAMTCRVANNTHACTQTYTLTSAVSCATSPRLFLQPCHHPAAPPLKLGGGVFAQASSEAWMEQWKGAAAMIKITLDNISASNAHHSIIAKIFNATWKHVFVGVRELHTWCLSSKIECKRVHSSVCVATWDDLALRAPESSLILPSLTSFHPSIPPPFFFLIQISHSMPCTCFSVIWTLAENFKQLSMWTKFFPPFPSVFFSFFERAQPCFQVHLIRRSRDGDYDMQMRLCYQRWHSLWSWTEER